MALKEYRAKRDFERTREPSGKSAARSQRGAPRFVIQKHAATRLHFDFRLEMGGVLKSWAVPKGLPTVKGDRRLAVQVEDHPIDYADFEGTIPAGNYGAGTVMVWDAGTYEVEGGDPMEELERGHLRLVLHGRKLEGEWTLIRMKRRANEDKPQWLIIKSGQSLAPLSKLAEDRSVLTNRPLEKIAADNDSQWQSNRSASRSNTRDVSAVRSLAPASASSSKSLRKSAAKRMLRDKSPPPRSKRLSSGRHGETSPEPAQAASSPKARQSAPNPPTQTILRRLPRAKPAFVPPMKALLVQRLPKGPDWLYELKFDGVRTLTIKTGRTVKLLSRTANDFGAKYPAVAEALRELPAKMAMLDGEIVALDLRGRPSFQLLQSCHLAGQPKPPLFYYVFDALNLEGRDLSGVPLIQRKAVAKSVIAGAPRAIRFSDGLKADSDALVRELKARGLEGLIAKRKDSRYEPGRRSGAWVKFKWTQEQEFVIGGYTRPRGSRAHFGALLVGYYQSGKLLFAAKVGTGFDQKLLASLHAQLRKIGRPGCPFTNLPEKPSAGQGHGLTAVQMRLCTWVEPRLVCQVRFAEWTRDSHLRQPAFLGLREDKPPREVVREIPAS